MKKQKTQFDEELLNLIIEAIKEKKGKKIVSIDLRNIDNTLFDFFVICHGESTTQVGSIAESVDKKLRENIGINPAHLEGTQNSQWILIDYSGTVVHVFLEEQRSFYQLEELWADGKIKEYTDE